MKIDAAFYHAMLNAAKTAQDNVSETADNVKYLYSLNPKDDIFFLFTDEMAQQFADLKGACEDYIAAYEYYSKKRIPIAVENKGVSVKLKP